MCVSLYGNQVFVWVMSTEKCVCVSLYGNQVFVQLCRLRSVCVCFSIWQPSFCAGHVD